MWEMGMRAPDRNLQMERQTQLGSDLIERIECILRRPPPRQQVWEAAWPDDTSDGGIQEYCDSLRQRWCCGDDAEENFEYTEEFWDNAFAAPAKQNAPRIRGGFMG